MTRPAGIVIGGGVAGLSAALGLLSSGFHTEVLEAETDSRPRVCGSFLNPDGVRNLTALGLLERAQEIGCAVAVANLHGPLGASTSVFTVQDGTTGMAIPRESLEDLLRATVIERGGQVLSGMRAMSYARNGKQWAILCRDNGEDGTLLTADTLVLADGRFSMGTPVARPDPGWYGWNATFRGLNERPGTLSLYFTSGGYVGTLTFADGLTNVSGLVRRGKGAGLSWEKVFADFQKGNGAFGRRMKGAKQLGEWRGVGPLPYTQKPRRVNGVLLAGDAAGVGDPFMGEGIGRALASGPLIARAFAQSGNVEALPDTFTKIWEDIYAPRFELGRGTRMLLDRPWLSLFFVDILLRPRFVNHLAPIFHRGAGFEKPPLPTIAG